MSKTEDVTEEVYHAVEEAISNLDVEGHSCNVSARSFVGTGYVTVTVNEED